MDLRTAVSLSAEPARPNYAHPLGALLLIAGLSLNAIAAPPSERARANAALKDAAKGELALARLQELGARVNWDRVSETGERKISIGFFTWPNPNDGLGNPSEPTTWKGDDADFRLLEKVAALGELSLEIDCGLVSPRALSRLRLHEPLAALSFYSPTSQMFEELENLPPCRRLTLSGVGLTPANFRRLAELVPGVESLLLSGQMRDGKQTALSDADLAELAQLEHLIELRISDSLMTDAGLKHLAGMKRLAHLSLNNCPSLNKSDLTGLVGFDALRKLELYFPVSAAGLASIARLGSLETLYVGIWDLEPAEAAPLGNLTRLRKFWITTYHAKRPDDVPPGDAAAVGDAIALAAAKSPGLQSLTLGNTTSERGLEAIAALPNLQSVAIQLTDVDDQSLALVSRLTGLRTLRLWGAGKLSDQGLAHLEKLTQLTELWLPGAGLSDESLAHLAGLTALEELDLPESNITGTGLAALGRLKELRTLMLAGSPFNDEGCRRLPQFTGLKALHLSRTKITDAGLKSIAELSDLGMLSINDDKEITDAGIASLARLKHLTSLSAWDTAVSEAGVHRLEAAMPDIDIDASMDAPHPAGGTIRVRIPQQNRAAFNFNR